MRLFEFENVSKPTKVILTDVDGVLLNWIDGFISHMHNKGYVTQPGMEDEYFFTPRFDISDELTGTEITSYNTSDALAEVPVLGDAIPWVKKLSSEGYTFVAITAVSEEDRACKLRRANLDSHFGKGVFNDVTCLPLGDDKVAALSKYKGTGYYWIEDSARLAKTGQRMGLDAILMSNRFNANFDDDTVTTVTSWADIYKYIKAKELKYGGI